MRLCIACHQSLQSCSKRLLASITILAAINLFIPVTIIAQDNPAAQEIKTLVKGRITDESGKPLEGVSVQLKGSSSGTVTNANGEYQLTVNSKAATLSFTYVGMEKQEIALGNKSRTLCK